jgi:hypothetical protein
VKKTVNILLLGLGLGLAAFLAFYYFGTASCREIMHSDQPELAWLKKEFRLDDAEFRRITRLHEAYLPQCAARCHRTEQLTQKLRQLLSQSAEVTPEVQRILEERARMRAECEVEMMRHFLEVSRTMPPEQGRRYLDWVQAQTSLWGGGMEQRHHMHHGDHEAGGHPM